MRTALTILALAGTLSACSLFGPEVELLDTTTLLQGADIVTTEPGPTDLPRVPFLTSSEDEEAFREHHGIAAPFPTVDYATDMVVAVVEPWPAADARVSIEAVELIGDDRASVTYTVSGTPDGGAERFPIHVVKVRRADLAARRVQTAATYTD